MLDKDIHARAEGANVVGTGTSGIALIAAERERQVTAEGWTAEHDDTHKYGELAKAAGVYAMPFNGSWKAREWPWEPEGLRHMGGTLEGRLRELVKAGALIAAEIDRLQRAHPSSPPLDPQGEHREPQALNPEGEGGA